MFSCGNSRLPLGFFLGQEGGAMLLFLLIHVNNQRDAHGMQEHMLLHTRRSSTQSDMNQMSH